MVWAAHPKRTDSGTTTLAQPEQFTALYDTLRKGHAEVELAELANAGQDDNNIIYRPMIFEGFQYKCNGFSIW